MLAFTYLRLGYNVQFLCEASDDVLHNGLIAKFNLLRFFKLNLILCKRKLVLRDTYFEFLCDLLKPNEVEYAFCFLQFLFPNMIICSTKLNHRVR